MMDVFRGNTGTAVSDGEAMPVAPIYAQTTQVNIDGTVFRSELEGVGHKIKENSLSLFTIQRIGIIISLILEKGNMDMLFERK